MRIALICLIILLLAGCPKKAETPVLSREKFEHIYTQAVLITAKTDSTEHKEKIDSLLQANGTTWQEIEATALYLNNEPTEWINFFDRVSQELQKEHERAVQADSTTASNKN